MRVLEDVSGSSRSLVAIRPRFPIVLKSKKASQGIATPDSPQPSAYSIYIPPGKDNWTLNWPNKHVVAPVDDGNVVPGELIVEVVAKVVAGELVDPIDDEDVVSDEVIAEVVAEKVVGCDSR
ncbi:hypothetical protein Tco_1569610 [Tanacetum coccineum]